MRKLFITFFLLLIYNVSYANLPYFELSFPRDEGAHHKDVPYTFEMLNEGWYLNGKLTTDKGKHFNYDISLVNLAFRFDENNLLSKAIAAIQITDLDNKKIHGVLIDFIPNVGEFSTDKLNIIIGDDYILQKISENGKDFYILKTKGQVSDTTLDVNLTLEPLSKPFLLNKNGLIPMMNDTNSYYYSIPHFKTSGTIKINKNQYNISKNSSDSWMNHQWGDFDVTSSDWEKFNIRLDNGLVANIILNIEDKHKRVVNGIANIILPSGKKLFISYKDFIIARDNYWLNPKTSISYPMTFNFTFPDLGLQIKNAASFQEQVMFGNWAGDCRVNAIYNKQDVAGFSNTEIVYKNP